MKNTKTILIFTLCAFALLSGCSSSDNDNLQKGITAYNNQDYQSAYNYFQPLAAENNV